LSILNKIKENPKISRNQISEKLKISPDTVKEYLNKLKNKKVLLRIGKTNADYWKIKNE